MILLSGDFHGNAMREKETLNSKNLKKFYDERNIESEDVKYHIILGDTGFLWPGCEKQDVNNLEFFNSKKFITLGVMGNHDNYDAILNLPEVDIGFGNPVLKLSEKFYYLKRGFVYNIDGKKLLVLGGGLSIDKWRREEGISWWAKEYWSYTETENLMSLIKDLEVDYIVSHTAPPDAIPMLEKFFISEEKYTDETVALNGLVDSSVKYKHWYFGHYHNSITEGKYTCLYKSLEVI